MGKKQYLFVLLFFFASYSFGQFYKSILPSPEFSKALEKIVLDFRADYKSVQGVVLEQTGDVAEYESNVKLPGTVSCKILRFHSVVDTTANWQAIAYHGDNYKEAVRAYQNIFRLVKKSQLRWIDNSSVGFAGELEPPREELRFTTSTLMLNVADMRYKDFRALVELRTTYEGWEVQLNLNKKTDMP